MKNNTEAIMDKEELRMEIESAVRLRKLKRKLISGAVIIAAVLLAGGIIWVQGNKIDELNKKIDELIDQPTIVEPVTPKISLDIINAELKEIGKLSTMEYLYTNAAEFSDSKQIKSWNIPFTKKSFILRWDGVIKAGVDVNQITAKLDEANRVLTVCLPQAEIQSHTIDDENAEVLAENDGLLNPVRVEDKVQFDAETKKEMEKRAKQNGLLEKAQENAEEVISKLLNANPDIKENYSIEFEIIQK